VSGPTAERVRSLLDYNAETGILTWRQRPRSDFNSDAQHKRWRTMFAGREAGTLHHSGYRRIRIDGQFFSAHRVIWLHVHGRWPRDQIDHINRIKDDNRLANLREATLWQNMRNKHRYRNNRSGVPGVCWRPHRRAWGVYISIYKRRIHLGYYTNFERAVAARTAAAELLHGDFHNTQQGRQDDD